MVASLGQMQLLRPAWVTAALAANDRLKLYLTVLQVARTHAEQPDTPPPNLGHELASAQVGAAWLKDLPGTAYREGRDLHIPDLPRVAALLRDDLRIMARPLLEGAAESALDSRVERWCAWLDTLTDDRLQAERLKALTRCAASLALQGGEG
ncbi:hypothetical protein ACFSVK_09180 [Azorhizophilus paspali]|uniref:hypothetical protein n=1 Tax=Azorhizophilus paspali TaxID=69963 RepID=UPI00362DF6D9